MRRLGTMVLAVAVLMGVAVPSALAVGGGEPLVRVHVDDRFVEEPDQYTLDVCGVEVRAEFHVWGHFTVFDDMTTVTRINREIVSTDPATGDVLLVESAGGIVFDEGIVDEIADEEAGTLTIKSEVIFRGVPIKWRIPGEGVVILDAGTVTSTLTLVFDLASSDLIFVDVTYSDLHGPHPSLTQPGLTDVFCVAMGA